MSNNSKVKRPYVYSHYLPWSKLIRLVGVGQILIDASGERYIVKQKLISNREGSTPQLLVQSAPPDGNE